MTKQGKFWMFYGLATGCGYAYCLGAPVAVFGAALVFLVLCAIALVAMLRE